MTFIQFACQRPVGWGILLVALSVSGCASNGYIVQRDTRANPLQQLLRLGSHHGPQPTERTQQLLRRYDLAELRETDGSQALERLHHRIHQDPSAEKVYAFAELAYVEAQRAQENGDSETAQDLYAACVAHAYLFLFDPRFDRGRNPYDPQFRGACDLYNDALESALRIAQAEGALHPGKINPIQIGERTYNVRIELRGNWDSQEFERFEFVSDYDINKLNNRYRSFGLGVPLIAIRRPPANPSAAEEYYPPGLSYAATAFLRVLEPDASLDQRLHSGECNCVLELYNPLETNHVELAHRLVPLQTDLSTPLAYFLDNPAFNEAQDTSTLGFLDPTKAQALRGLYMLEAYDPSKIPVLMVHGLWSSPLTWMEMFNDLRAYPEIRDRYQFWFYLYPTGQPFWASARQLREDLAACRKQLDPQHQLEPMDQMVLVGHSMGGLVSRMQTAYSNDDFWRILSDKPFEELNADPEEKEIIAQTLFFEPNPSIRHVVTIGTPHRGSNFANDYTQWISRKLIRMPKMVEHLTTKVTRNNPNLFKDPTLLTTSTSLDSLDPDAPILPVLIEAEKAPWVQYHNIVGVLDEDTFVGTFAAKGDGVVPFDSAHMEDVVSETIVEADHVSVHRHPLAVLKVRDILRSHLVQIAQEQERRLASLPPIQSAGHARLVESPDENP